METMEKAYVRPQHMGWNSFQEQGADILHDGLVNDKPSIKIMSDLNQLYQSIT
jgi:multiple sugar transport system substrate-binding protein